MFIDPTNPVTNSTTTSYVTTPYVVVDKSEKVNHPYHYNSGKFECIDVMQDITSGLTGIEAVDTAQVLKYLWRWKHKNGVEDLKKAKWYLEHLIRYVDEPPTVS